MMKKPFDFMQFLLTGLTSLRGRQLTFPSRCSAHLSSIQDRGFYNVSRN